MVSGRGESDPLSGILLIVTSHTLILRAVSCTRNEELFGKAVAAAAWDIVLHLHEEAVWFSKTLRYIIVTSHVRWDR